MEKNSWGSLFKIILWNYLSPFYFSFLFSVLCCGYSFNKYVNIRKLYESADIYFQWISYMFRWTLIENATQETN